MKAFLIIIVFLIIAAFFIVRWTPSPLVIAHRGASYFAPEETKPAFLLAQKMGADYLEMDIQRTLDGVLIAVHDKDFERTTNIKEVFPSRVNDPIGTFTWNEVQQLDTGSWFNRDFPKRARSSYVGLHVLTLEEIVDLAGDQGHLYIESKSPTLYPGYEKEIVELLNKKGRLDKEKIIFESFDLNSLVRFKELAPEIPRIWLLDYEHRLPWSDVLSKANGIVQGLGPAGYESYPWQVISAHRSGFLVHTWTVNKAWQMWLLKSFGVDGIFTNCPETALILYRKKQSIDLNSLFQDVGY